MALPTHITYLFGAGASYNAMPVQNELAEDMLSVFSKLKRLLQYPNDTIKGSGPLGLRKKITRYATEEGSKLIMMRMDRYLDVASTAVDYPSVDTLAKENALRDRSILLDRLKEAVEYYFYLRTFQTGLFNSISNIQRSFRKHDPRYIGFVTSLLSREDLEARRLVPTDVSILSYNYDLELEWALSQVKEDILQGFIQPNVQSRGIVHLNGRANVHNMDPSKIGLAWWDTLADDISAIAPTEISYAWERSYERTGQLDMIITNTTHLVVIGYSFPVFNREVDRQILAAPNLKKIYLQDLKDELPGIQNRVHALLGPRRQRHEIRRTGINDHKIESITVVNTELVDSVDQFHIPFELL